jgi:GntR family transcriptional regulator
MKKFNVSRLTVRRAIEMLCHEGLLKTRRGEGTFVTEDEKLISSFRLEFTGFMDDLFYQVSKSKTKSVKIERISPSKDVCEKLELQEGEEVIHICRIRYLRNRPFAYTENYFPLGYGLYFTEEMLYEKPVLQIMQQEIGVKFTEAFQTIEASFSNQDVSDKLGIASGSPILFVNRILYAAGRKPVEYVQSSYRGDRYKYVVRLKMTKVGHGPHWVHHSD